VTSLLAPTIMPRVRREPPLRSRLHEADPSVIGLVLHRGATTYLEQCVASLAAQTHRLAAIVVAHLDGGDPPSWVCRLAPDVHVLSPSRPASTAAVVAEIAANYPVDGYLFQESTDWSAPDRLERLLEAAANTGAGLVGSDFVVVFPRVPDARTRVMPPDGNVAFERGAAGTVVEPSTMLVDRVLLERLGGFNTTLAVAAANEFVARAAAASRVVNVSRPLCFTREHDAPDWSSSSGGDTLVGRVVAAAMSERSRHHAVSLARRQEPDVARRDRARRVELVHVDEPGSAIELSAVGAPKPQRFAERERYQPPVFVVSAFESLSRFVTCCIGQHPDLQAVEVTPWMTEVAQLSARFVDPARRDSGFTAATAVSPEALFRAARAAVDALFVDGPFAPQEGARASTASGHRWIGAVEAERIALTSAAMLYRDAVFLHVARPVDEAVAAHLELEDDADIEELYNRWLAANHTIHDFAQLLGAERMHTLHYDRLVDNPDGTLDECLRALGETPSAACAGLFQRSGAAPEHPSRPIADLPGIASQQEARRLSVAMSGRSHVAQPTERAYLMARILAEPNTDTGRRRRSTDIADDDRNPYAAAHDLVRRCAPKGTVVCVVSKGDEMAVRIRGHSVGWHFPQTADGAYAGYHPTDAREAIAHLEHLRDLGAEWFLIPKIYVWWLRHYTELRMHLERTYVAVPSSDDEGVLFDLRRVGGDRRTGPSR
jgi:hypothetical protein